MTSDGYLTSGVGYAHHPHRDTWYSAPMAQLNWWLPIYDIETSQSMAFHPYYFDKPIKNGSAAMGLMPSRGMKRAITKSSPARSSRSLKPAKASGKRRAKRRTSARA